MATMDKDFQAENWWATVSGAGTPDAAVPSWADDYTRSRTGIETTYSGVDAIIGRRKSVADF
jgi:hypothetical protein